MQKIFHVFILVFVSIWISACQIDAEFFRRHEFASEEPPFLPPSGGGSVGTSLLSVKSDSDNSVAVDQTNRTITINNVSGGRISSFALFEDGLESTGLSCSQTPSSGSSFIHGNTVNWDPGFQPTGSPAQGHFVCNSDGGSVEFIFNSKPASVRVASSGWSSTLLGAQTSAYNVSISADGSFLAWASDGTTSSGVTQILGLDISNGTRSAISLNSTNQIGNNYNNYPSLSGDGRYVLFVSAATNYVAGAGSSTVFRNQLFVKDRQTGAVVLASSTDGTGPNQGNQSSLEARISSDGNYVVFTTSSTNLIAGMPGGTLQVHRKNLQTGIMELVSSTNGTVANRGNASSNKPQISQDGRYVVFSSNSTNLVAGSSGTQIFRKDMNVGTIVLVSSTDGTSANRGNSSSTEPQISDDGRYVTFTSGATNLVAGSSGSQIYRKDLNTGTIVLVSSVDGAAANRGNGASATSSVSADGSRVVFRSSSTNLVSGITIGYNQIYVKDLTANTIGLVSSANGTGAQAGDTNSDLPEISRNGRYVVFRSKASNLVSGTGATLYHKIFLKDLQTGVLQVASSLDSSAPALADSDVIFSRMSPDARHVVFVSGAKNLVAGVTSLFPQTFYKDLQTGSIVLISSSDGSAANSGNSWSGDVDISANGRYVVFASSATNIMSGTTSRQIFRRDLQTGSLELVSSTDGTVANRGNSSSDNPRISSDGRYIAFTSWSTNLKAGVTGGAQQVYLKDMNTQAISLVSSVDGTAATETDGGAEQPSISADGTYVTFLSYSTNLKAGLSGDGQVFRKNVLTQALDLASSTDGTGPNRSNGGCEYPEMSQDGRYTVFVCWATNFMAGLNFVGQVWKKDLNTGTLTLVSSTDGTSANKGTNDSYEPSISADGRYVVFSTAAGNLYPGTGVWYNIVRKDLVTNNIALMSSRDGTVASVFENYDTFNSQVSADGRYVLFETRQTNLVDGIFGTMTQLFVRDAQLP
ncbi:hypothetical protein [Bdellovibrio sp. HCB-110]|uniref:hypothetical protein n=1 Tax=Bdellovibrio sp. HCB-110 TaxID=3391182 RepID=UPI0039B4DF73